jgi:hypothetical protein
MELFILFQNCSIYNVQECILFSDYHTHYNVNKIIIKSSFRLHEAVNAYPVREYFHCSALARRHSRHLAQPNANIQFAVVVHDIQQPPLVVAVFQLAHTAVVEEVAVLFDSDSFAAAEAVPDTVAVSTVAVAAAAAVAAPDTVVGLDVAVAQPHFLVCILPHHHQHRYKRH